MSKLFSFFKKKKNSDVTAEAAAAQGSEIRSVPKQQAPISEVQITPVRPNVARQPSPSSIEVPPYKFSCVQTGEKSYKIRFASDEALKIFLNLYRPLKIRVKDLLTGQILDGKVVEKTYLKVGKDGPAKNSPVKYIVDEGGERSVAIALKSFAASGVSGENIDIKGAQIKISNARTSSNAKVAGEIVGGRISSGTINEAILSDGTEISEEIVSGDVSLVLKAQLSDEIIDSFIARKEIIIDESLAKEVGVKMIKDLGLLKRINVDLELVTRKYSSSSSSSIAAEVKGEEIRYDFDLNYEMRQKILEGGKSAVVEKKLPDKDPILLDEERLSSSRLMVEISVVRPNQKSEPIKDEESAMPSEQSYKVKASAQEGGEEKLLKLTFASKDARENFYIDCDKEGEYISDLIENGELREDGDRSLIIGPVNDYQKFYKKIISNLEIGKRLKKPVDAADSKFIDDIKNMVERKKRESRKLLAKIEVSQEIEH